MTAHHRSLASLLMCLTVATTLVGGQAVAPWEARVAEMVKSRILAQGVPSVSVAVMREGKLLMAGGWGEATPSTIFPIGSVSKEFTAALVLKLVDRGRVALTDPIGKHLQGLSPEVGALTVEQLLNHTSGLPRDVRNPGTRFEVMSTDGLIQQAAHATLATKPGATYGYSNAGYMLLGALVEKAGGKSFGAALRDDIAAPLGLATLARCGDRGPREAPGHALNDGKLGPAPGMHHSQLLGAGGICSTAEDLVKWRQALHGGRVLSAATYGAMIAPRGAAVAANYGFGLYARPAPWGDMAIVGGGQALSGHTAELHWYPGHSLAVALLYNVAPRVPGVADLVPRIVLGVPLTPPTL